MIMQAIRKAVTEAYVLTGNDTAIPKYSAQFVFAESPRQVCIRIPAYEAPYSGQLFNLLYQVITLALPQVKMSREDLKQHLLTAHEGKQVRGDEFEIQGIVQDTVGEPGQAAHAIIETRIIIWPQPVRSELEPACRNHSQGR